MDSGCLFRITLLIIQFLWSERIIFFCWISKAGALAKFVLDISIVLCVVRYHFLRVLLHICI